MDSRLYWLALAAFVGAIEGGLIAGLLPLIGADLGVSLGQAGLVVLFYSLAYAFGPPLLALLLGGVGRRRILAGSEFGFALCALLIVLSTTFEALVVVRTALAVVAGTYTGTAMATAAMIAPYGKRGRYMQVISMGQAIAALAGVPLGAWIAAQFGWRVVYVMLAIMAGFSATALYLKLPRGMMGDTLSIRDRLKVLRNPGVGRGAAHDPVVHDRLVAADRLYRRADDGGRRRLRGAATGAAGRRSRGHRLQRHRRADVGPAGQRSHRHHRRAGGDRGDAGVLQPRLAAAGLRAAGADADGGGAGLCGPHLFDRRGQPHGTDRAGRRAGGDLAQHVGLHDRHGGGGGFGWHRARYLGRHRPAADRRTAGGAGAAGVALGAAWGGGAAGWGRGG